jgi:(p)ppGpp synthase/HD superfamily hydrolase
MVDIVSLAQAIAERAHRGQVDKLGVDYIEHPRWVAGRVQTPVQKASALLHDVLEDTDYSVGDLLALGVPFRVVQVVKLLTRSPGISPEEYYAAIRKDSDALAVKIADVDHNTHPSRTAQLPDKDRIRLARKYSKARQSLLQNEVRATG